MIRGVCVSMQRFGARVGVSADHPHLLDRIGGALGWKSARIPTDEVDALFTLSEGTMNGDHSTSFELRFDSKLVQASPSLDPLLQRLESEIDFQIANHARGALFVHAGVVGWRGRAIVIPGRSLSGKTSLTAALSRAGAEYCSDEYAVIDTEGRVHPYSKPLSIRDPDGVGQNVCPTSLGVRVRVEPLRAGLILSTRFVPETQYAPVVAKSARGLMHLIDNTVVVRAQPHFALECLTPLACDAWTLEGDRGEAEEAAAHVLRFLDTHRGNSESNPI